MGEPLNAPQKHTPIRPTRVTTEQELWDALKQPWPFTFHGGQPG